MRTLFIALLFAACFVATNAYAFSDADKKEVQAIVSEYIKENPKEIMSSLNEEYARSEAVGKKAAQDKIQGLVKYFEGIEVPAAGNLNGDVTVIEFFDYNCGYCKRAIVTVKDIIRDDANVRVLFAEMPILGKSSRLASTWALAAHKQGKYFAFHKALMENKGPITPTTLERIAKSVDLDVDKLKTDAASDEISDEIDKSLAVAKEIGVRGTPAFVVGRTLYPGMMDTKALKRAVNKERSK